MQFTKDVEKALELIERYYRGPAKYAEAVVRRWPASGAVVAYIDGDLAGAEIYYKIQLASAVCVHYYVAVAPKYRNRGVATSMVRHVEDICKTPTYMATTTYDNTPTIRLFTRLGYRQYQWGALPRKTREVLLKSTCGYDDDILLIKGSEPQEVALYTEEVKTFWRETCLKPYLDLK